MVLASRLPSFSVTTTREGQSTVVALRGRVEHGAAFVLGARLDSVINQDPGSVVLDLSELDFMGATAMVAVSNAERRLAGLGSQLTVRSQSGLINRLLNMMEMAEVSRLLDRVALDTEQLGILAAGQPTLQVAPRSQSSALIDFRRVTAMPADPDVVDGALRLIVELARALVEGADGVSVSLLRHGELSTVAASDQTILDMDADQYRTGEGPCVDASLQGHWFHAPALSEETRWPTFTPQARDLGINAILSSPLKAFDEPVGALNVYSRTPLAFKAKDQAAAAVFAKKASVILSDAGAGVSDTQMALRYQEALRSRKVITLATGVIMEREGIDDEDAFRALLRLSLYHDESLRSRAEAMVRSSRQSELDSGPGTRG